MSSSNNLLIATSTTPIAQHGRHS
jgi:hypothetical protein